MKKASIILGYIISFFEIILVVVLIFALIFKKTVGDKKYVFNILDKKNYYQLVDDEIKEEMLDTITSSGFDDSIINDLTTLNDVKEDVRLFINNLYEGKKTILKKDEIKIKLDEKINTFLKNINLDVVNKDEIIPFEEDIQKIYENEITLYQMTDGFIGIFNKVNQNIDKIIIGLIVGIVLILVFLIILRQIKFLGSIIIASGLIICFLYIGIYENIDVDNLLVITENFSTILTEIIRNIGVLVLKTGLILVTLGIVLSLTLSCKMKRK